MDKIITNTISLFRLDDGQYALMGRDFRYDLLIIRVFEDDHDVLKALDFIYNEMLEDWFYINEINNELNKTLEERIEHD